MIDQKLILIGGKGGVGRTTFSVVLAEYLAALGKRVLIAHVRSAQDLSELLGCPNIGHHITPVRKNLWAVNMRPKYALEEIGVMVLRFKSLYKAVFENKIVSQFIDSIPAIKQYSMLGKAWYHTTEEERGRPRFDTVILDGPATGHMVSMLRIPSVIMRTTPNGPLTKDAKSAQDLLTNPKECAMWLVTLAEEMPVNETLELYQTIKEELGIHIQGVVANSVYPEPFPGVNEAAKHSWDAIDAKEKLSPTLEALKQTSDIIKLRHDLNESYLGKLKEAIDEEPVVTLPHIFKGSLGHDDVYGLMETFRASFERKGK